MNISVLYSDCGGHAVIAGAVKNIFEDKFHEIAASDATLQELADKVDNIAVDLVCADPALPDILNHWSNGTYKGLDIHCYFAINGWNRSIQLLTAIGKICSYCNINFAAQTLEKLIIKDDDQKPDMIVSVLPMINYPLLLMAKKHNIPVLCVAADMNNALYSFQYEEDPVLFPPHRFTIPYSCLESAFSVNQSVAKHNIAVTGYPLREEFSNVLRDDTALVTTFKQELGIDDAKDVVMISMGSLGGTTTTSYVKKIITHWETNPDSFQQLHFIVACGRNTALLNELQHLFHPYLTISNTDVNFEEKKTQAIKDSTTIFAEKTILLVNDLSDKTETHYQFTIIRDGKQLSFSVFGYTKRIHQFFAISTCAALKPGSGSIAEAISQQTPILVDAIKGTIPWERLNCDIVDQYSLGEILENIDDLPRQIENMVAKSDVYIKQHRHFRELRKDQFSFSHKLCHITKELLEEATQQSQPIDPVMDVEEPSCICNKLLIVAQMIIDLIVSILVYPIDLLINFSFFSAFYSLDNKTIKQRRKELLLQQDYTPIEGLSSSDNMPIDAVYLHSSLGANDANPVVIYIMPKPYQNIHPQNYEDLLAQGTDVVLWNPTHLTCTSMTEDLTSLVSKIHDENPNKKIAFRTYCIGANIGVRAAMNIADTKGMSIPIVVDRGFTDAYALAFSMSFGAAWFRKSHILKAYDLGNSSDLPTYKGPILFMKGTQDTVVENIPKYLFESRQESLTTDNQDEFVEIEGDHWAKQTTEATASMMNFFKKHGIIETNNTIEVEVG
ncbi:MAG: hypothetical protein HY860_02230 [Chlamydiales bacterium]|nr:hypothetical protein [Chlamydiales bacterium]